MTKKFAQKKYEVVETVIKDVEIEKSRAKRYNKGKKRFNSSPWRGIANIGLVSHNGAGKYGDYNYKNGFPISELENSALRHLYGDYDDEGNMIHGGYFTGEYKDPESRLPHLAHVCWNLCVIMEQLQNPKKYGLLDNRYKEENTDES